MTTNNLITKVNWTLNDYCESECSYCPIQLRGGPEPQEIKEYLRIAYLIITNYKILGRKINWTFNGGEPLDMKDIVTLLKLCREKGNSLTLHTNGGKLWMDWWAIEPYVDDLHLTYHYWQNPNLIKYIIDTFHKKQKNITVSVPMRPDFFDEDLERARSVETQHNMIVGKCILYKNASTDGGMFNYTEKQLAIMSGIEILDVGSIADAELVKEREYFDSTKFEDRLNDRVESNPVYTGKLCNAGIECLNIGPTGWVSGSDCNNEPLGNIWHNNWNPPTNAQICHMRACISKSDQTITKFL